MFSFKYSHLPARASFRARASFPASFGAYRSLCADPSWPAQPGGRDRLIDSAPRIAIGLRRFLLVSFLSFFVLVDEHPDPVDVLVNGLRLSQAHCHPIFLPVPADARQNADRRLTLVCSLFYCVRHVIPFSSCNQAY